MTRLILAFRAFFLILFKASVAERVRPALEDQQAAAGPAPAADQAARTKPAALPTSQRSDALTLLATLQREARFVDLVREPLENYTDAQIGAAARDVLRDCGRALSRMFDLQPVVEQAEGAPVDVPAGFDPDRYRVTGNVAGHPPFHGRLMHQGWEARKCQVASWTGSHEAAGIVAPAEVELS